jgi:5-methylcytosine-specific restriction endonuclease McrA
MTHPFEQPRSVFYQAFVRDGAKCVYCGRDILESYDTFSESELDHLKPKSRGGPDDDPWNRVTSCGVCNNLKGAYDPSPGGLVTEETFEKCVDDAKAHIAGKRSGAIDNSYFRDYQYWLKELGRLSQR